MKSHSPPPLAPISLSLKLWLFTNLFGCLAWLLWFVFGIKSTSWSERVILTLFIAFFATATSLLTVPLASWFFATILHFSPIKRLLWALVGVSLFWLLSVVVMLSLLGGWQDMLGFLPFAAPHLVAAYVTAAVVYRHWLFRTNT